tara:strand:- start:179 stop:1204 length:1026 start_codon:yes stop_codon:yes gene_type:complete
MRRQKRNMETFNLSFLDVVCCGFGAVILLLVITKIYEPITIQNSKEGLQSLVIKLAQELEVIRGDSTTMNKRLTEITEQISENDKKKNKLQGDLFIIQGEFNSTKSMSDEQLSDRDSLFLLKQKLNEAQQRLQTEIDASNSRAAGIPVDSEYVIFIIDNSPSMTGSIPGSNKKIWNDLKKSMVQILDAFPEGKLKGLQVMNCNGAYLYPTFAGEWIPDTGQQRNNIIQGLNNWYAECDSNPVAGIYEAVSQFGSNNKIALWILGDDLLEDVRPGYCRNDSAECIRRIVARYNKLDAKGEPMIRVHGKAFVNYRYAFYPDEFFNMLRVVANENYGAFVVEFQ